MHLKSPIEPSKGSAKKIGVIRAFAANTNPGLVRNYNEDRVAIILNILKPVNRASKDKGSNEEWPSASLFGVYDGHGGYRCADYLRDNVHNYLV
jgi:serine/threonine protein phosphatase PrpC